MCFTRAACESTFFLHFNIFFFVPYELCWLLTHNYEFPRLLEWMPFRCWCSDFHSVITREILIYCFVKAKTIIANMPLQSFLFLHKSGRWCARRDAAIRVSNFVRRRPQKNSHFSSRSLPFLKCRHFFSRSATMEFDIFCIAGIMNEGIDRCRFSIRDRRQFNRKFLFQCDEAARVQQIHTDNKSWYK